MNQTHEWKNHIIIDNSYFQYHLHPQFIKNVIVYILNVMIIVLLTVTIIVYNSHHLYWTLYVFS